MENKSNNIMNVIMNVKGNTIVTITYKGEVRMNKGGRQCSNLLWGHNVVKYTTCQYQLGNIYENSVNNRAEKESGERTFETQSIKGKKWIKFPYVLSNMEESTYYIRFYAMKNAEYKTIYFVDGHIADAGEMAIINEYKIENKFYSAKQADNGLTKNQVECRDIKVENILSLTMNGEKIVYNAEEYALAQVENC